MAKRYYWLKLKKDFFDQKEIKRLRRLAGGDTYTIIYLKLLLKSMNTDGKIYFDGIGDDFSDELSLEIDEDSENIKMTLAYLESKGLLEVVDENEYYLSDIPILLGSETDKAAMMRNLRNKRKKNQIESGEQEPEKSNNVTKELPNSYTEKEIEIEKEIEKENNVVAVIVSFWDNNGFGFNNIQAKESLLKWLDDSKFKEPSDMILKALEIASASNIRNLRYVEGILKNWENSNILTVEEIESNGKKPKKEAEKKDKYEDMYDDMDF